MIVGGFVQPPEAPPTLAHARSRSAHGCESRPVRSAACRDCMPASRHENASSNPAQSSRRPTSGRDRCRSRRGAMKGAMPLTREELTALRDAIDMTLALPDSIRELLAQWLAPEATKPNGQRFPSPCAPDDVAFDQGQGCTPRQADPGASCRAAVADCDARQSWFVRDRARQRRWLEPIGDRRAIAAARAARRGREGSHRPLETEGRGAAPAGPSSAVAHRLGASRPVESSAGLVVPSQ